MTSVSIDPSIIAASDNLRYLDEGSAGRFMLAGQTSTVVARYTDGSKSSVDLFPDRDTGHRKLMAILQP